MIKGILSLFTSGMFINPMFLIGLGGGAYLSYYHDAEAIYAFFFDFKIYVLAVVVAFIYTFLFNRVQKSFSTVVDWPETFKQFITNSINLLITLICATIFFEFLFF